MDGAADGRDRRSVLRAGLVVGAIGAGMASGVLGAEAAMAAEPTARSAQPGTSEAELATEVVFRGPPGQRRIALTFDDGPTRRWTPTVLSLLARHQVPATFFLVGARAQRLPDLVLRAHEQEHQLGNHTWHHHDLVTRTGPAAAQELLLTDRLLTGLTGARPTLMRPPWGHVDPPGLLAAAQLGYRTVLWSHLVRGAHPQADTDTVLAGITPGSIVLAHDGGPTPTAALYVQLDRFISTMHDRGYAFVTVDALLG